MLWHAGLMTPDVVGPNKAVAAGAGAGLGGAVAILILALLWPDASASEAGAVTMLCSARLSVLGAYFVPHGGEE